MSLLSNNNTGILFPNTAFENVNQQSAYVNLQPESYSQGQLPLLDPILLYNLTNQPTFHTTAVINFLNATTSNFPMMPGENWHDYCARVSNVDREMADTLIKTCVEYARIKSEHISELETRKSSLLKQIASKNMTETDLNKMNALNDLTIDALQKLIAVKPLLEGFDLNANQFFQFVSHDTTSIDQKIAATKKDDYASRFNLLILKSCVAKLTDDDKISLRDIAVNLKMDDAKIDQLLVGLNSAGNFVSIKVIREFVEKNINGQQIIDCYSKFVASKTYEDFLHLVSIYVTVESYGTDEQKSLVSKQQIRELIIHTIDIDLEVRSILLQRKVVNADSRIDSFHFYSLQDLEEYVMTENISPTQNQKALLTCRAVFQFSEEKNKEELINEGYDDLFEKLKSLNELKISEDSEDSPTIRKERLRITAAPTRRTITSKDTRSSVWEKNLENVRPSFTEYISNFLYNSTDLKMTFLVQFGQVSEATPEKAQELYNLSFREIRENDKKIPRMTAVLSQMLASLQFSDEIISKDILGEIERIQTDLRLFGNNVQDLKAQEQEYGQNSSYYTNEFTDSMNLIDGIKYSYVPPREWGKNLLLDMLKNDYNIPIRNFISFNILRETVKEKYVDKTITYTQAFQLVNLIETIELQEMLWSNEKKVALSYNGFDSVQHFTRLWYKSFIVFTDAESSLVDLAQAQKDYYFAEKYFETKENTEDTRQIKILFDKLLDGKNISEYDKRTALSTYRRLLVIAPISEERETQLRKGFFKRPQENFNTESRQLKFIIHSRISLPIQRIRASYFYVSLVEEAISKGIDLINVPADYQTDIDKYTKAIYNNAKYQLNDKIPNSEELLQFQNGVFKMGKYGSEPIMISLSLLFHEKYSVFPEQRKDSYLK